MAESYGDFGLCRKLDHLGRKLTRAGFVRSSSRRSRPYRGMLAKYPNLEVEAFLDHLEQADLRNPPLSIDVSGLSATSGDTTAAIPGKTG